MTIATRISFGVALPHRSDAPISRDDVELAARTAEDLGFDGLWVTENTLNTTNPHVICLDPVVALSFAAAVTNRIKLGLAVAVLNVHHPFHLAHQWASLDQLSQGRAILGVGLGREFNYDEFGIPADRRVRRFEEMIELVRELWSGRPVDFRGELVTCRGSSISLAPVRGRVPILLGGTQPAAIARAVRLGDGWIAPGAGSLSDFREQVAHLKTVADGLGRPHEDFMIVKRVHVAVDDGSGRARLQMENWFEHVYRMPGGSEEAGLVGTPNQVADGIRELIAGGATHLVLNPVDDFPEQLAALAETVALVGANRDPAFAMETRRELQPLPTT